MTMARLILASNSPRRRGMLAWTGRDFLIHPVDVDETPFPGEEPRRHVQRLAAGKAHAAARMAPEGLFVVAADTIVVDEGAILGKPRDAEEAAAMLRQLRGHVHQVFTALVVVHGNRQEMDFCSADVPMRNYSDAELEAYVASGDPLDKAGAYAIQHAGFHPVESFTGCFACVMGLPLCHLERTLQRLGEGSNPETPRTCQENLEYYCPVYESILSGGS